jgi:hypothetical protein
MRSYLQKEIRDLLHGAVEQLSELQSEILALLKFFKAVFEQVKLLGQDEANPEGARMLIERVEDGGFREDDDIKNV